MEGLIGGLIRKYGTAMAVLRDSEWKDIRAFWQPVDTKGLKNIRKEVSPLGEIPGGQYLLISAVGTVQEGETVRLGQQQYVVRQLDAHYYGDTAVYDWALCTRKGEEAL